MSKFEFKKLNELCNKITDGSHYSPVGIENGIPMLSVKDMLDNGFSYNDCKFVSIKDYLDMVRSNCKPLKGDVLIAKDGSYLKHVFVIKEEIDQAVLSSIGILRPNQKIIYPEYLKYYLQTASVKQTVSKKYVSGSALPRIILKNFGEIDVIYRNLIEQKKIASVLSSLDSKIELNNRINVELEQMAKTIYDYWFVQFDFPIPAEYSASVGQPELEGKPYKSSGGKMVWSEELKREVPEGWEVKKLEEVVEIKYGKDHKDVGIGFIPVYGSGGIMRFGDRAIYDKESILIPRKGTLSNLFYLDKPFWSVDTMFYTKMKVLKSGKYLFYTLERMKLASLNVGTAVPSLTTEVLSKLKTLFPSCDIISRFDDILIPMFEHKTRNTLENQKLTELRDWLLPILMNGQVKVGDEEQTELLIAAEPQMKYGK